MLTALDHIIIGVHNLEQATTTFTEHLELAVSGGGIHPTGGTENRIIVIGDTYLELIAVRTPSEAQQSMLERLALGNGYMNFVLASNDILADGAAMVSRGASIVGPRAGELKSVDGRVRAWNRIDVERPDLTQHYPFIIQHDSTGEERRFRLAGWTTPPAHPLGATKVLKTTIAVADLTEATRRFQHIYGLSPSEPFSGETEGWEASLVSFALGESQQRFELAAPLSNSSIEHYSYLPGTNALSYHLQRFGESLCRMTLLVEDLTATQNYLDSHAITHTRREGQQPTLWLHPEHTCGATIVLTEHETNA